MKHFLSPWLVLLVWLMLPASEAQAGETALEIDYLLSTIGKSQCTFERNGKRYAAEEAEAHLRMKLKRGKRYATTTEHFIKRLASKSSMSNKLYFIDCDGYERKPSGEWLTEVLLDYRSSSRQAG